MSNVPPPIQNALICVSDKSDILDFAQELYKRSITIMSTGGTAKYLREAGITVLEVSEYTGFSEIMEGRFKTLHPLIHGGILARRGKDEAVMRLHGIIPFGLVVANLYPFESAIIDPEKSLSNAIDYIDIGGPAMIRAAAKNFKNVTVVVDKIDYNRVLENMEHNDGGVDEDTRYSLAVKAFEHTARYDRIIANYLGKATSHQNLETGEEFPSILNLNWYYRQGMRYGENPHQKAAFYVEKEPPPGSIASARQLQGKKLSYNNITDVDAAIECVRQFDNSPTCAIIKHSNPCGVASGNDLLQAYDKAHAADPESAFGGIIAFNRELDERTAREILKQQFVEVVVAPEISEQAGQLLAEKESLRVLSCGEWPVKACSLEYKQVVGGLLVQDSDAKLYDELRVVTIRKPSHKEMNDLQFAWRVVRMVKSNAIVFASDNMTIGIGAGQMSRITATRIAEFKAERAGFDIKGAVMASDAFFPFIDSIEKAATMGITSIIQPGGSVRDKEVIEASNAKGISMVFTGTRHFRH